MVSETPPPHGLACSLSPSTNLKPSPPHTPVGLTWALPKKEWKPEVISSGGLLDQSGRDWIPGGQREAGLLGGTSQDTWTTPDVNRVEECLIFPVEGSTSGSGQTDGLWWIPKMLMTQMFPTAEEKVVRSKSQLMGPPASLTPIVLSTFGDDSAVWEHNVLGTEAGDDRYWGMQTQTLLDAHGQEGQLGQVVPK